MDSLRKKYSGLGLLIILALVSGCVSAGSSPQSKFYSLSPLKDKEIPKIASPALKDAVIGVGPLELPAYLSRPQIVTRGGDNELVLAEFNRWAEHLDEAIVRVVSQNLMSIFPESKVFLYPWGYYVPVKYQVAIEVISIEASLKNEARISLGWSLLDAKSKNALLTKNSVYNSRVDKSNYNGVVEAINQGLYEFSLEIARAIAADAESSSKAEKKEKTAD